MEDDKIKWIEEQLVRFEEIYKEKMRLERDKLKAKNPKSLEDFEMPEDNDYNDWTDTIIFFGKIWFWLESIFFIKWNLN